MGENKIIRIIPKNEFRQMIKDNLYSISVGPHALFRVSEAQRKIYKAEMLIGILSKETPSFIGLQQNGRYTAFFRKKDAFIRIIFALRAKGIEIITFFNVDKLPDMKK